MLDLAKRTQNLFGTEIPVRIVSAPENRDFVTKAGVTLNHPFAWVLSLRLPNPLLPDGTKRPKSEMVPFLFLREEDLTWLLPRTENIVGLDVTEDGIEITIDEAVALYNAAQKERQEALRANATTTTTALNVQPIAIKGE